MATVTTGARISGRLACHRSQPECVIEFAVCQQSRIRRDQGAAKLQHQAAVKIELECPVVISPARFAIAACSIQDKVLMPISKSV